MQQADCGFLPLDLCCTHPSCITVARSLMSIGKTTLGSVCNAIINHQYWVFRWPGYYWAKESFSIGKSLYLSAPWTRHWHKQLNKVRCQGSTHLCEFHKQSHWPFTFQVNQSSVIVFMLPLAEIKCAPNRWWPYWTLSRSYFSPRIRGRNHYVCPSTSRGR